MQAVRQRSQLEKWMLNRNFIRRQEELLVQNEYQRRRIVELRNQGNLEKTKLTTTTTTTTTTTIGKRRSCDSDCGEDDEEDDDVDVNSDMLFLFDEDEDDDWSDEEDGLS
jgi:hypothetical protein